MKKFLAVGLLLFLSNAVLAQTQNYKPLAPMELLQYRDKPLKNPDSTIQTLKYLYVKYMQSPTYQESKYYRSEYLSKARFDANKDAMGTPGLWKKWVSQNVSKTAFGSVKEADDAYDKMIEIQKKLTDENLEYSDLLKIVLFSSDGKKRYETMMMEVVKEHPELPY